MILSQQAEQSQNINIPYYHPVAQCVRLPTYEKPVACLAQRGGHRAPLSALEAALHCVPRTVPP